MQLLHYAMSICWLLMGTDLSAFSFEYSPIIQTTSGPIRGRLLQMASSPDVYEFGGIPFAEAPVGALRFAKAQPKQPWKDVLDATSLPAACPQMTFTTVLPHLATFPPILDLSISTNTSEDCLYLTIWVPWDAIDSPNVGKLAAVTNIHGGGFSAGSLSTPLLNGSYLASKHSVVVGSIQYRVNSLGFAYSPDHGIPGNMGLWDQLEAIKWICSNLPSFGSDCDRHTIMGESAGGASVTYHLLSKDSRKYFKQAISQSGTALAPWATRPKEQLKQMTNLLITHHCAEEISLDCLRRVESEKFPYFHDYAFGPVADGDFLTDEPMDILRKGDFYKEAPLLIGATRSEGSFFTLFNQKALELLPMPPKWDENSGQIEKLDHSMLEDLIKGSIFGFSRTAIDAIKYHYWPANFDQLNGSQVVEAAREAIGDYFIACSVVNFIAEAKRNGAVAVFQYEFSHFRQLNPWPKWFGSTHADDLGYTMGTAPAEGGDADFQRDVMEKWANFIKFGAPVSCDNSDSNVCSKISRECFVLSSKNSIESTGKCTPKTRDCQYWLNVISKL